MKTSRYIKDKIESIQVIVVIVFIVGFLSFFVGGDSEEERIEKMRLEEDVRDDILMNLEQYDDFHFEMEEQIRFMYQTNELESYLGDVLDREIRLIED